MPAFALIGIQLSEARGIPIPGALFVGVVNGVGGGLLRDVVAGDVPALPRPGQFSTLSLLLACGLFLVLRLQWGVGPVPAAWTTVLVFFVIRLLTLRFNWQTRPVLRASAPPEREDTPAAEE